MNGCVGFVPQLEKRTKLTGLAHLCLSRTLAVSPSFSLSLILSRSNLSSLFFFTWHYSAAVSSRTKGFPQTPEKVKSKCTGNHHPRAKHSWGAPGQKGAVQSARPLEMNGRREVRKMGGRGAKGVCFCGLVVLSGRSHLVIHNKVHDPENSIQRYSHNDKNRPCTSHCCQIFSRHQ